jgi:hypothetical protein
LDLGEHRFRFHAKAEAALEAKTLLFQSSEWLTGHIQANHSLDGSRGGLTTYTGVNPTFEEPDGGRGVRARRSP